MEDKSKQDRRIASAALFRTAGWVRAHIDDRLQPLDISSQQLKVLWVIEQQPRHRATVNTIREHMMDPGSNVSRLLNKLMDKRLIEKRRSSDDQRVVHIHITPAGRDVLCSGRLAMDEGEAVFGKLEPDEIATLTALLVKLRT